MKKLYTTILIGFLLSMSSCTSTKSSKDQDTVAAASIVGRWKLEKEERRPVTEKGVVYKDQPTYVILNVQKNGYFILYDTFIDPAWKSKGLPLISERSKGQWEMTDKVLKLHHNSGDTSYTETIEISEMDKKTLVTKGQDAKSNVYKTYGK